MRFGTNYNDTLNLLYLELLRSSVKFGKRWSGDGEWKMRNGEWGMGNGEWGMRNSGQP